MSDIIGIIGQPLHISANIIATGPRGQDGDVTQAQLETALASKADADDVAAHLAESVQDVGGVHGLEMESGTWTPTVSSETTVPTTLSYVVQRGTYDRIGNIVKCAFFIRFTLTDGDGDINIGNFPFIVKALDETGNLYRFTLDGVKQENTGVVSVSKNINYFRIANGQSFATIGGLTNGNQVDISGSVIYRLI
jgi:hypothetical protein